MTIILPCAWKELAQSHQINSVNHTSVIKRHQPFPLSLSKFIDCLYFYGKQKTTVVQSLKGKFCFVRWGENRGGREIDYCVILSTVLSTATPVKHQVPAVLDCCTSTQPKHWEKTPGEVILEHRQATHPLHPSRVLQSPLLLIWESRWCRVRWRLSLQWAGTDPRGM